MTYSIANIVELFSLEDISGVKIPASRMARILERLEASKNLSHAQKEFLHNKGYRGLLKFAQGEYDLADCRVRAREDHFRRIGALAKATKENANKAAESKRKMDAIFAKQERAQKQRQQLRELPDRFDMPFIEREDMGHVKHILRSVEEGFPIHKDDLIWLGLAGGDYWTPALKISHHANMAKNLSDEWEESGDTWAAVNACGHWRKAKRPEEGFAIVDEALKTTSLGEKVRSALLTTGGGASRDLGHRESAKGFGEEAHVLTPKDFRPCTLLGAINIEMGAYSTGAEWYEKAEERGANANLIDRELRSILSAADPTERNLIKKELKGYNASRYSRF